ncbi:Uncharacterized protein PECH_006983 [Penicillium ucsense]|uniref:WD repeat protein n=1 Tax=Penicillium ucsense TaxID=2839758 RepID=A0A8J8W2P2_9EURO|nr:Uncharacterized protein PECM_005045 [Penicillium ucsense]KAF7739020.1 Uncharacterized protein PECH_006983 [Penicillium ucsense]
MPVSLEHVDACLPISALKIVPCEERLFIFQGQGPFFRVIEEQTGRLAAQVQAFKRNHVHGFITFPSLKVSEGSSQCHSVVVWGGKSLRIIQFSFSASDGVDLTASSAEYLAPDWLMSGCATFEEHTETIFLVTANNALLRASAESGRSAQYSKRIRIEQLTTSVKCILYAADLTALSPSHILIASGTAFGEIVVWSCFLTDVGQDAEKPIAAIHHYFTGHDGSVFGVRLFPNIPSLNAGRPGRLLASCSDDRTIRIWDITDCEAKSPDDPSAYSTDGFELRSTGYGSGLGSETCVAKAFGHAARIWNVNLCTFDNKEPTRLSLISRSEDRSCIVWELSWDTSPSGTARYDLREMSSAQPHIGKHVWALDIFDKGEDVTVFTGGADGALKSFKFRKHVFRPSQYNTPSLNESLTHKKIAGSDEPRSFDFISGNCILSCSLRGELRLGCVAPSDDLPLEWETLCVFEDLRSFSIITGIPDKGIALIASSQGLLRLCHHSSSSIIELVSLGKRPRSLTLIQDNVNSQKCSLVIDYYTGEDAVILTITQRNSGLPEVTMVPFKLPKAPYIITAACFVRENNYLLLGSELGGLAVYGTLGLGLSSSPLVDIRRVHGHEGTTSIREITANSNAENYVLTCGRDGQYCYHNLIIDSNHPEKVSLETLDQSSSSLGQDLWGVYLEDKSGDLMIYGFRSQNFVLRNETRHQDVISIASGGARRLWSFRAGTGDELPLFVWLEKPDLQVMRIVPDANRSIRAGGHGREIRAMDGICNDEEREAYFATGAEDTVVRIFAASRQTSESPWGSFKCLKVLDKHRSGIQQVSWSKNGQYLFTSAGLEEFFVWKVQKVSSLGTCVKLVSESPKSEPDSELRVTSFDTIEVMESNGEKGFLVCLTLSNSIIRIFHFSPYEQHQFTLLAQGRYMTNCLTQIRLWTRGSSVSLVTAATDGFFTIWDLTDTLDSFYEMTSSRLKARRSFRSFLSTPKEIACETRYQVQSNSVKGMELVSLSAQATVVLTAGDDSSITVSLLRAPSDGDSETVVSTLSIPDAHAASATAIQVLNYDEIHSQATTGLARVIFASSGNDHRLKFWCLKIDLAKHSTEALAVEFLLDRYSAVADIAALTFLPGILGLASEPSHADCVIQGNVVVGGAGMEMLRFTGCGPEVGAS